MSEALLRFAHVIGAVVLLGTGAGIAFFMVVAVRTRNPLLIAHVSGTVVIADALFTATAVVVQPVTGYLLARQVGWTLGEGWIALSLVLYGVVGLLWLPVVWIQIRLRDLARSAAHHGGSLPPAFEWLYRIWLLLGVPAFFAVLVIVWLMLTRPDLTLF